jgi:hypothetical protein
MITRDPRSTYTAADRKEQFDLSMKLYNLLGDMTFAVDRINGVRLVLEASAANLPANDPLATRLRTASQQVDELRKRIVATKEGGAITGEQRLREYLTELYSSVIYYEGRPTQMQVMRTDAISRELNDVVRDFDAWSARELNGLNSALAAKQLPPIKVLTRSEWETP